MDAQCALTSRMEDHERVYVLLLISYCLLIHYDCTHDAVESISNRRYSHECVCRFVYTHGSLINGWTQRTTKREKWKEIFFFYIYIDFCFVFISLELEWRCVLKRPFQLYLLFFSAFVVCSNNFWFWTLKTNIINNDKKSNQMWITKHAFCTGAAHTHTHKIGRRTFSDSKMF